MSSSRSRAIRAAVTSALVAILGAGGFVLRSGGFGAGDLAPFALWCVFLAALVAASASLLARLPLPARRLPRVGLAVVAGLLSALLYTLAVALGLGPWMGAFSVPVFPLWAAGAAVGLAVAAWPTPLPATPRPRLARALVGVGALLAAVVLLPAAFLFGGMYLWDRAEHEVHLIPAGFRGPVVIVFGQARGAPPERDGRVRLYRIPRDGVLRTQFGPNDGWSAPDYYYVDAFGRRSPIVRGGPCDDSLPGDPVQACLMGRMYINGRRGAEYSAYVVARRADLRTQYERGDSLVRAVVFGEPAAPAP